MNRKNNEKKTSRRKDPYRITTGFGRPKELGVVRHTTIYLYEKYGEVYPKFCELAKIEGMSFSELTSRAMKEYVEFHYPGNPQLTLQSVTDPLAQKPLRLQAKFQREELKSLVKILKEQRGTPPYREDIRDKAKKLILKLSRLNRRLRNGDVDELIQEAVKVI